MQAVKQASIQPRSIQSQLIKLVDWRGSSPELPADLDWTSLLAFAQHNRLLPLLQATLKVHPAVPELVAYSLKSAFRQSFIETTFQMKLLEELAAHCTEFEWVLLRGPLIGSQFYPRLSARPFVDLDILVSMQDLERCVAVLRSLGYQSPEGTFGDSYYRATHLHIHLKKQQGQVSGAVEVHWYLDHPFMLYTIDTALILERRQWIEIQGCTIPAPEKHDLFLALAVHMVKHVVHLYHYVADEALDRLVDEGELLRLLDLGLAYSQMHPHLDWLQLKDRAAEWNALTAVQDTLLGIEALWPGTVAPEHLVLFGKTRRRVWRRWLMESIDSDRNTLQEGVFFRPVRLIDIVDFLFPPHEHFEREGHKATLFVRGRHFLHALKPVSRAFGYLIYYSIKSLLGRLRRTGS
jgi:hypothetical protein